MAGNKWFLASGGKGYGPFPSEQLRQMTEVGIIDHDDLVWREGDSDSIPASAIGSKASPLPAAAEPRPSPPPLPIVKTTTDSRPSSNLVWVSIAVVLMATFAGGGWLAYDRGWLPIGRQQEIDTSRVTAVTESSDPLEDNGLISDASAPEESEPSLSSNMRIGEDSEDEPVSVAVPTAPRAVPMERSQTMTFDDWQEVVAPNADPPSRSAWSEADGGQVIQATPLGFTELQSKTDFTNFRLSFEWRFPEGESAGVNGSGVVIRSDGWNEFGIDPRGIEIDLRPKDSDDGFLGTGCLIAYDTPIQVPEHRRKKRHIKWLKAPVLAGMSHWNSCEIVCRGDHLEVFINDVLVNTANGIPIRAGKIVLRSQRAAVRFHNVVVEELKAGEGIDAKSNAAFISLFDGESLDDWKASPNWKVQNGTIRSDGGDRHLQTVKTFERFDLRLEFQLPTKGNSGILLPNGEEVQLVDDALVDEIDQRLKGNGRTFQPEWQCGAIHNRVAPRAESYRGANKWNTLRLLIDDDGQVTVEMNEVVLIDKASYEVKTGPIALVADKAGGAKFRNLAIRRLAPK